MTGLCVYTLQSHLSGKFQSEQKVNMNCLCDGKYVLDLLRKHNVEIHKHCYLGWLSDYFY